jgi:DNA methyltransferase 1-associated protein 1
VPFKNAARSDELVLRHWQRKRDAGKLIAQTEPTDGGIDDKKEPEVSKSKEEDVYPFAKYNVKAQCPKRYTDEQYNKHLRSDNWSREETDYLMDLVQEYDLRWVVISDRYEYPPNPSASDGESTALVPAVRRRTMEEMKARYYTVAANMLALEHPPSEMSEAEFDLYEKMTKFNPEHERTRKELATLQLNRTKDEVNEETLLLEELKRIVANEKSFMEERKELYARLEAPISTGNTAMYQSSQGLSQLLQSLLQADKSKKRRALLGPETGASSPGSQPGAQNLPASVRDSRPDTPSTAVAPATTKKGGAGAAGSAAQQPVKILTEAEEAKYGVSHHDRLASGVQFRNDKAQKLTQAKSNIQSMKLAAALTELEIPPRLVMPTERVCKLFEKLVHSVNLLLDARKVSEKVESEIRVLEAGKLERERKERERAEAKSGDDDVNVNREEVPKAYDISADNKDEGAKASGGDTVNSASATPVKSNANTAHKRSASVLSAVSDKSYKRQRK